MTTFVQFGGTWRFRHMNGSSSVLLCEITPDNILYKNIPLQTIPLISCKVNATNPISTTHHRGRVMPGAFLQQAGQWKLTFNYPPGMDFVPHVTLCPPIGQTGFIAAWPHTIGNPTTELFIATSEVTGAAQTYSFYITIY